ncbi:unnamed protein product [Lactuca virosa]|uniref:Ubiquitin-like protease family profile domain-containing protein n=1 Tax=Lactuca virosa TaxID=75947 RepID=A0AAU9PMA3_9ASTR|nr:unnamed protein product [Lactuca virosa]
MLSFYICYINWNLTHEESPPRQHSPPIVSSPPRRKKYNSETSSTEFATNASSSQQHEIERTYMSSDTSTRSGKKKKMRTKELMKRLLGIVADLTSNVDRVLQKKDEPDTGFGEEEDMVNEEEEEIYYHVTPIVRPQRKNGVAWYQRTPFTVKITQTMKKKAMESPEKENEDIVNEESNDVSNHLPLDSLHTATNGVGGYPKWKDVDMVLFPINIIGVHWFLVVLHLNTWKVHIYDSAQSMNFFSKYLTSGEFKSFGDSIISELDVIEYWNDFPYGYKDNTTVEFVDTIDAPQREYIQDRGDCGVFVCMFMEMIVSGVPVKIDKPCKDAGFLYKNRMTNIIWDTI